MRRTIGLFLGVMALGAPEGPALARRTTLNPQDHLRCAAMISAFDRKIGDGTFLPDASQPYDLLVAAMTHLNAFAIPSGLQEREAFERIDTERERILATMGAEAIRDQALRCMANLPHSKR